MANFEKVGESFIDHYYKLFANDRAQLISLYQPQSMLTFEGEKFQGPQAIANKLAGLAFQKCKVRFSSRDSQPAPGSGVLIFICGEILPENEENALRFSQVFNLQPVPNKAGSFFILNDLFRLHYG